MKKTFIVAALVAFTLTSCSENSRETTTAETETHTEQPATKSEVVIETPDYSAAPEAVKTQLSSLVDSYLKLKDELVASDAQKTQEHAKAILTVAEKVDVTTLKGEQKTFAETKLNAIKKAAQTIAGTTDLVAQRTELQPLSEATFALTKAFGAAEETLYYQYCPMAFNNQGAYWISSNEEVRNPYFGDAMLKCGSNREVYKK